METRLPLESLPKDSVSSQKPRGREAPLSAEQQTALDAYWRAANYVSVGQIYLLDNPLFTQPLTREHIKPRLLGHWGTTPGLNFIYVPLNRIIKECDLNMIYVTGPGHGGPGLVANVYLKSPKGWTCPAEIDGKKCEDYWRSHQVPM